MMLYRLVKIAGVLAVAFLGGAAGSMVMQPYMAAADKTVEVVEDFKVRRITIVDKNGVERGGFGIEEEEGLLAMGFTDRDEKLRIVIGVSEDDEVMMAMNDEKENPRIMLMVNDSGDPMVFVLDKKGDPVWGGPK